MKEKILVSIDLTPASKVAFIHAVKLAEVYNYDLEIIPMIELERFVQNTVQQDFYGYKEVSRSSTVSNFLINTLIEEGIAIPAFEIKINMTPKALLFFGKNHFRNDIVMMLFGIEKNNRYETKVSKNIVLRLTKKVGCPSFEVFNNESFNKRSITTENSDLINIFLEERNKNEQK